jgi:hypothetical protein
MTHGSFMVGRPELLAADTLQTGHDEAARDDLWRRPLELAATGRAVVNLEPWYEGIGPEGIGGRFGAADQLFAYWASMAAGCRAACYGAHGLWNAGDGAFLGHWGGRTLEQALALDTPRLIGLSHAMLGERVGFGGPARGRVQDGALQSLELHGPRGRATFFPDLARAGELPPGELWRPLEGRFLDVRPARGPAVVVATITTGAAGEVRDPRGPTAPRSAHPG